VIPVVAGSNPVGHPNLSPRAPRPWRAPALRGATPRAAFRAVSHAILEQIELNARGVLVSDDAEFLHQLRVGLRRLRAALRAFRDVLPSKSTRKLKRSLRKLSPKLGAARDWDVLVARLEAQRASPELLHKAQARRAAARRVARRALVSKGFANLGAGVRGLATTESRAPLGQFAAAALERAHRKLITQAHGADWSAASARHALRIRVKRLRYGCEFFAPAFPVKRVEPYLGALKALQDILGGLNDVAVGRRLLGFAGDEAALLRRLGPAWRALERRPVFWRAPA
jgi:triphosphatase